MPLSITLNKIAVYIAFILSCLRPWLAALEVSTSVITIAINLLIILGLEWKTNRMILLGILYVGFVFVFFSHSIVLIFDIFLLSYELKIIGIKRLALINIACSLVIIFLVMEGLGFGTLHSHSFISHKGGEVEDLGFNNTNALALFLTNIVFMLTLITSSGKRFTIPLLLILSSFCIYNITMSRTSFISLMVCGIAYFLFGNDFAGKRTVRIISYFPIFLSALLFSLIFIFNNIPGLNLLTSGRLHIFDYWFNQMRGLQYLFGINVDEAGALDGSYYLLVIYGGIPTLLLFLYRFQKNLSGHYKYYRKFIPFIIGMLTYGIAESNLVILSGMCLIFWHIAIFNPSISACSRSPKTSIYENSICL